MTGSGVLEPPAWTVLRETAEPLADGGDGGGKEPRRGFDAALFRALNKTKAMVVRVFHVAHQIEIASERGHGAWILTEPHRPALPAASDECISTSLGGHDLPRISHRRGCTTRK